VKRPERNQKMWQAVGQPQMQQQSQKPQPSCNVLNKRSEQNTRFSDLTLARLRPIQLIWRTRVITN
jgi:hypothetical protein